MTKTVCWNAIVKNESKIIERCMQAMVGNIDYWVVVDTGSTDGTQEIIRQFMTKHNIPGELVERPWVNFSHNRSEALELAEGKADYILLCDADMILAPVRADWRNYLGDLPSYSVIQRTATLSYGNIRLVNGRLQGDARYRYWGATHEYCDSIEPSRFISPNFPHIEMVDLADGGSKADKFERDIILLTKQLEELERLKNASEQEQQEAWQSGLLRHYDTLMPRCTFYLAQTYRDLDRYQEALTYYEKRVILGGWEEEVWYAMYQCGVLKVYLNADKQDIINTFVNAYRYRTTRAESLYELAKYLRIQGDYALGYIYAIAAAKLNHTKDRLFVHHAVYDWKAKDEAAVCAYWIGAVEEGKKLCLSILDRSDIPLYDKERIVANLNYLNQKSV